MDSEKRGAKIKLFNYQYLTLTAVIVAVIVTGCSTGGGIGLGSLQEPVSYKVARRVNRDATVPGNQANTVANSSPNTQELFSNHENRQWTSNEHSLNQLGQANYIQTADPENQTLPLASLVTLGPNDDFDDLVHNAPEVVLVDFYADWCGPCRKQGGILHEMEPVARQNGALILKVNVDQRRDIANKFQISSLPTLVLISNGKIIHRQSGLADEQRISSMLVR